MARLFLHSKSLTILQDKGMHKRQLQRVHWQEGANWPISRNKVSLVELQRFSNCAKFSVELTSEPLHMSTKNDTVSFRPGTVFQSNFEAGG